MNDVVANGRLFLFNPLNFFAVLVDVKLRNAANWNLEETLYIIIHNLTPKLTEEWLEALNNRTLDALHRLLCLDALIDALLNEDAIQGSRMEKIVKLAKAYFKLLASKLHKTL